MGTLNPSQDVPDPLRLHRCRSLRPGCQAQRPGPHPLPPELRHLLQGQRCRRLRRLGPCPRPLGLLLPPLLDCLPFWYWCGKGREERGEGGEEGGRWVRGREGGRERERG